MGPDPDILIPLAGMVTALIIVSPIIRAVVRSIDRKGVSAGSPELEALRNEIRELRDAADESHDFHDRLVELEERADFTERLLAQGRSAPKLNDGETS